MCSTAPPTTSARAENNIMFGWLQPAIMLAAKSKMPSKIRKIPAFLICFFILVCYFCAKVRKKFGLFKKF